MSRRMRAALAAGALAVAAGGGIAAGAVGDAVDPAAAAVVGSDLAQAADAALRHAGGGRITEIEVGDGESAYEVEIDRPDGREVEVHLDQLFQVVASEPDDDTDDDEDDQDED